MTETQTKPRFVATRHASFTKLGQERETYALVFKWHQGWHYISIEFQGQWVHDNINVFDYETDTVKISTWPEFQALIAEYMEGMTRDELRKRWAER